MNPAVAQPQIGRKKTRISRISSTSIPMVKVLGTRFHAIRMTEALNILEQFIQERHSRHITFTNAQTIALCQRDPSLQQIVNHSDLNLPDGMSIVWGSRWHDLKIPERVAGPDLTEALCERASEKGYRVFLMGTSWPNLEKLQKSLISRHPNLRIVGIHSPPVAEKFSEEETQHILHQLRQANPDILLVGVSCPKQERWIAENLHRLEVPVNLGVGAAFDFLSGQIPRAPEKLQKMGLEWLHRLSCEPRRLWKRYLLGNFVFLSLLIKEKVRYKFSPK